MLKCQKHSDIFLSYEFQLPQDMEDYLQRKLTNNVKQFLLKPNVVPHILDCRMKRPVLAAAKERKNMRLVQEAMSSHNSAQTPSSSNATSEFSPTSSEMCVRR
ncbi:hypothetical protein AVEN_97083-1 [Araneus ventricosus]|uniref:Uncharacterized protein n=1 Tax=Araneus ventricosus TaxID=182803 RepID=A0A4Y2EH45_ARAVE|nr:hypothetical protein AVEN_97083-1 [Araneus ventricosus]